MEEIKKLTRLAALWLVFSIGIAVWACSSAPSAIAATAHGPSNNQPEPAGIRSDQTASGLATIRPGTPEPGSWVIPFYPEAGQGGPMVHARLNDKIDVNLLIDTGTNIDILSPSVADKLGLPRMPVTPSGAAVGPAAGPKEYVRVEQVAVAGGFHLKSDFLIADALEDSAARPIDGILSAARFAHSAVLFDFGEQKMTVFNQGGLSEADLVNHGFTAHNPGVGMTRFGAAPNVLFEIPIQAVTTNGRVLEARARLDTGSRDTLFPETNPPLNESPIDTESVTGYGTDFSVATVESKVYKLAYLQVDNQKAQNPRTSVAPTQCYVFTPKGTGMQDVAAIGISYLSHFRVLIDYAANRLYLEPVSHGANVNVNYPNESAVESGEGQQADATFRATPDGEWVVTKIDAGDGFFQRLGLKVNDLIVKVNGQSTRGALVGEVSGQIIAEQFSVWLTVKRAGHLIDLFSLKDLR